MNGSEVIIDSLSFPCPPILEIDHASSFFALDNTNALDTKDHVLIAVIALKNLPRSGTAISPKVKMVLGTNVGSTAKRAIEDIPSGNSSLITFGIKINSNVVAANGTLNPAVLNTNNLLEGCLRITHGTGDTPLRLKLATNHTDQDVIKIPFLAVCVKDSNNPSNSPEKRLKSALKIELTGSTIAKQTKQIGDDLFVKFEDPQIDKIVFQLTTNGAQPPSTKTQDVTIQRPNRVKHFFVLDDPGMGTLAELDVTNAGNASCN